MMPKRYRVSEWFRDHPNSEEILQKLDKALDYFPEIRFFYVSRMGTRGGSQTVAQVIFEKRLLRFNVHYNPSMNVIFHELGHLLYYDTSYKKDGNMPDGEEACTFFALARIPVALVESELLPYLGLVPKDRVRYYCRLALALRDKRPDKYLKMTKEIIECHRQSDPNWPIIDSWDDTPTRQVFI